MYLDLFLTFAKVGVMTFGGGYAMLPILQREVVENKGWATESELADYFAIGQCTPGVIAVNTATFLGSKLKGVSGGVVATLGMVFPSAVIISVVAAFLSFFAELPAVIHAFSGIRACVCALILASVIRLGKQTVIDVPTGIIAAAVCLLMVFSDQLTALLTTAAPGLAPALGVLFSPVAFVIVAGALGLLISFFGKKNKKGGGEA